MFWGGLTHEPSPAAESLLLGILGISRSSLARLVSLLVAGDVEDKANRCDLWPGPIKLE
jgi:hypothetical protein